MHHGYIIYKQELFLFKQFDMYLLLVGQIHICEWECKRCVNRWQGRQQGCYNYKPVMSLADKNNVLAYYSHVAVFKYLMY